MFFNSARDPPPSPTTPRRGEGRVWDRPGGGEEEGRRGAGEGVRPGGPETAEGRLPAPGTGKPTSSRRGKTVPRLASFLSLPRHCEATAVAPGPRPAPPARRLRPAPGFSPIGPLAPRLRAASRGAPWTPSGFPRDRKRPR